MGNNQTTEQSDPRKPILLVGGGTGGHIFPLVALGEELTSQKVPFIFVGERNGRERQIVAKYGWKFVGLVVGKYRRYRNPVAFLRNIADLGRIVIGFFEAITLLSRSGASTVFSKGGYVALPLVLAAAVLNRRIIIHESDAVMGLTNRLTTRFAGKILTAFAADSFAHHDRRYEQVGIPIRRTLRRAANLKTVRKSRPLIFVIGGIQGSASINRFIRETLTQLTQLADIIHVTGEAEAAEHKKIAEHLGKKVLNTYKPFAFITRELPYYYQSADLVISRASATTIAEAALFSRAMYLIPLANSASDHQLMNARRLQAAGAAVFREERTLSNEKFVEDIKKLLSDRVQLQNLGGRLKRYFNGEFAVERIVELLTKSQRKR